MITNRSALNRQFPHGKILLDIADAVVACLQPDKLVQQHVAIKRQHLYIGTHEFDLRTVKNIYVIGAGKATFGMAKALHGILGKRITKGYINVPVAVQKTIGSITVNQASHPLPNQAGLRGAQAILKIAESAKENDLVICLISGGGSSLLPLPLAGITLEEKVSLTNSLLKAGANIFELNAVRKHISAIKGGRLASAAAPATVMSLIISDVVGDEMDVIASGPTVTDHSTQVEAIEILDRYKISKKMASEKIRSVIHEYETPKQFSNNIVYNTIIGNNQLALEEVAHHARRAKITPFILTSMLRGEAKEVAQVLASVAHEIDRYNRPVKKPALLIAGGETTVTVLGQGQGGRNQELVLAAVPLLNKRMSILSLATDGVDGMTPTPVAGAIADGAVAEQCVIKGVNYHDYLYSNDSFNCLRQLGCLLKTGPTGTNVGDVVLLLIR